MHIVPTSMVSSLLSAYLQSHLSVLALVVSAWLAEQAVMRGEWRCVSMECGGLWPTFYGTPERPQWCANSLDTRTRVSEMTQVFTALSVKDLNYQLTLL